MNRRLRRKKLKEIREHNKKMITSNKTWLCKPFDGLLDNRAKREKDAKRRAAKKARKRACK